MTRKITLPNTKTVLTGVVAFALALPRATSAQSTNPVSVTLQDASAKSLDVWNMSGELEKNWAVFVCTAVITNGSPRPLVFPSNFPEQPLASFFLTVMDEGKKVIARQLVSRHRSPYRISPTKVVLPVGVLTNEFDVVLTGLSRTNSELHVQIEGSFPNSPQAGAITSNIVKVRIIGQTRDRPR